MEITQRAYANKVIADTFLIAGAGFVQEEDRDSIGQAADYLLQRGYRYRPMLRCHQQSFRRRLAQDHE